MAGIKGKSGGSREGSGRPKLPKDKKLRKYQMMLRPYQIDYLRGLKFGEASKLIRKLLDQFIFLDGRE